MPNTNESDPRLSLLNLKRPYFGRFTLYKGAPQIVLDDLVGVRNYGGNEPTINIIARAHMPFAAEHDLKNGIWKPHSFGNPNRLTSLTTRISGSAKHRTVLIGDYRISLKGQNPDDYEIRIDSPPYNSSQAL